jgi:lysine-N-methylase
MAQEISRPRLAQYVAARRHVAGGEALVALYDLRDGARDGLLVVGEREWTVLRCADGTRDLDGIACAAAARGAAARVDHVAAFLARLGAEGLLAEGVEATAAERAASLDATPAIEPSRLEALLAARSTRPLDPLRGHHLACARCGACCGAYATILFSPLEALRTRALCPEILDSGVTEELLFTPERSAAYDGPASARGVRVVAATGGRCALLGADRGCSLHARGGAEAKPAGCRIYPRTHVDDGLAIRISISPECPALFARPSGGEPLAPEGGATGADLAPEVHVDSLPERIPLAAAREARRGDYTAWSRRLVAVLEAGGAAPDAARALWSLSAAVESVGLDVAAAEAALSQPAELPAAESARWLAALGARVQRHGERLAALHAAAEFGRETATAIAAACTRLAAPAGRGERIATPPGERTALDELVYLTASLHGHLVVDGRPLATSLRDRATRLLAARSFEAPGARHPIATVEALLRSHGLAAYADGL